MRRELIALFALLMACGISRGEAFDTAFLLWSGMKHVVYHPASLVNRDHLVNFLERIEDFIQNAPNEGVHPDIVPCTQHG